MHHVTAFHDAHPLEEGEPVASARRALADLLRPDVGPPDPRLIDPILDRVVADGLLVRTTTAVALPSRPGDEPELDPVVQRVVEAISAEPTQPPTIKELVARGSGATRWMPRREPVWWSASRPIWCSFPTVLERARRSSPMPATPGSR